MSKVLYRGRPQPLPRPRASLTVAAAEREPATGGNPPRRVFIDCSAIDFAKQPTGIPRVVRKYIEVGYAWGAQRRIAVIPVIPSRDGLTLVRPVPGKGAPPELVARAAANAEARDAGPAARMRPAWDYLRTVVHHGLAFAAALLPVPPVKAAASWIDDMLAELTGAYDAHLERSGLSDVRFVPGPGDVLFAPAYWHDVDPAVYRGIRARGADIVILVHDLLPIVFEHFYPSPWRYLFKENVRAAFGYASGFFCVSSFTRRTLWEFGQRNKLDPVPMMTAYNGFEPLVSDAAAADIANGGRKPVMGNPKLYDALRLEPLVMVGSVEPKKGHVPVIRCLEALWQAGFQRPLLIIGRPGWMERDVVAAIRGSFFFGKKIFWFSDADDFDLAAAYIACHALICSSIAEGFGIPMIEAAYYGKPTVALDTPIVREILGDKALLFASAAEFVQHVTDLENADRYAEACRAAESVRWPLWEDYTPLVFDRLVDFVAGRASLPEVVAPRPEIRVATREAAG